MTNSAAYRQTPQYKAYMAEYHRRPEQKAKLAERKKKPEYKKKAADYEKARYDSPQRKARSALQNAVRYGKIVKPETCSECSGGGPIHGHHHDYSQPLNVRWLCVKCHNDEHN